MTSQQALPLPDSGTGWTAPVTMARRHAPWDVLLIGVGCYILAAVGRIHQLFPVLEPLHPALIGALAALFTVCLDNRRINAIWSSLQLPTGKLLVGLVLWMALSIPGSIYQGNSVGVLTTFLKTFAMCLVVAGAARTTRDAERLALVYYLCAAIYAAVVLARFHVGDAGDPTRLARLYYYDANDFAVLAVTAVPLGLHFIMTPRPRWQRLSGALGTPALITTIVWSGSRGGFLALLVVTAMVLMGSRAIPWRWRIAGILAVAAGISISASDSYWARITTIVNPGNDYNRTSDTGRLKVWRRGLGYMMDAPVFGVGAGNFPVAEGTLSPIADRQDWGQGVKWSAAHNSYVEVGAELGIPGLLLLLGTMWYAARGLGAVRREQRALPPGLEGERNARLARTLQISLAGFATGGFFLSLGYSEMLYALIGLAMALRRVTKPPRLPLGVTR